VGFSPGKDSRIGRAARGGLVIVFLLHLVLLAGCSSLRFLGGGESVDSIAVIPFENFSEDNKDAPLVMPCVMKELSRKGVKVADEKDLMPILLKNRVRSFAYISSGLAREIGETLNVRAVLIGTILYMKNDPDNPRIGLAARLVDTASGRLLWADYVSLSGKETKSILGIWELKKMEKLIPRSVKTLFSSFQAHYRPTESRYRVAVIPFKNNTSDRAAGTMITNMFLAELFRRGHYEVIEMGDVRELMVRNRIKLKGEIDHGKIEQYREGLGADGILIGSVEIFSDVGGLPPKVDISVRLVNARSKKVMWLDSLHFTGEKDIIAFTWQEFKAADKMAYQAVSKLSGKMERAKWN
jgi:TolB-like protein